LSEREKKGFIPLTTGEPHGIGHFGTMTINTLRIEKGFKMWGNEMNCDVDIIEAGLDNFVRWNKKVRFTLGAG
jgi:dimethylglycine dehydrogenase